MDLSVLRKYEEKGLVRSQKHPTLPLSIWKYTETTQYERLWDDITLYCRGLVIDEMTGEVIVKPMKKFFNYEEIVDSELFSGDNPIPNQGYVNIQTKEDGSLGILFNYKGEWIMATTGSFNSPQGIKGLEMVKSKYNLDSFDKKIVYFCEIIYPENRIVVDYGDIQKVVFISCGMNANNELVKYFEDWEYSFDTSSGLFRDSGINDEDIVHSERYETFSTELFNKLKSENTKNKEGYVLRFEQSYFRMKIKFEDYINLHRIVSNASTTGVWNILMNGQTVSDVLGSIPDESYPSIKEYEEELSFQYNSLVNEYKILFNGMVKFRDNRKLFAELAKNHKYPTILFNMLDGMDYSSYIWKVLKPEYKLL